MKLPSPNPRRREERIWFEDFADEALIYDGEGGRAHLLARHFVPIWKACNGEQSPEDLERVRLVMEWRQAS